MSSIVIFFMPKGILYLLNFLHISLSIEAACKMAAYEAVYGKK